MIEQKIKAWIDTMVEGANVKLAPYDGNRPDNDYITYQPMTIVPQLHSYDKVRQLSDTGMIDETIKFTATLTVSINAYSQAGYSQLQRLNSSSEVWEARLALGDDISLSGTNRIQNLTSLGDERHRARFQSDFEFFIDTEDTFTIHRLSEFFVTGRWFSENTDGRIYFGYTDIDSDAGGYLDNSVYWYRTEQIDFVQQAP